MFNRREFLAGSAMLAGAYARGHALGSVGRDQSDMLSLVPSSTGKTADYFCTWHTQYHLAARQLQANDMSKMLGADGAKLARAELTEANLLGPGGMAETFYPSLRADLMFVLDDGWDVPPSGDLSFVGSLEIDTQRFPSFKGTPEQRLAQLNRAFRDKGWHSAGLWIAAQMAPAALAIDARAGKDTASDVYLQDYWKRRLSWSQAAGIRYWKVDWGKSANDVAFRAMLSALATEFAPDLILEATLPCGPLNQPLSSAEGQTVGRVEAGWIRRSLPLLHLPGTFRVYDSLPFLSASTLLDRIGSLLRAAENTSNAKAVLNSEDEVYLGAVLGCDLGIMRHPFSPAATQDALDQEPRHLARRLTEVKRAVRWHRIAPPFAVGVGTVAIDEQILWDRWEFTSGQTWLASVIGKTIRQGAPARIARGLALPEVNAMGEPPYVIAAKHPNGSLSLATVGRASPSGWTVPLADVRLEGGVVGHPIGVFGRYRNLTIHFDHSLQGKSVLAQDLATDHAIDITKRVTMTSSELHLSGTLIDDLAASVAAKADGSEPGILLLVM